jgi:hypothetical protein
LSERQHSSPALCAQLPSRFACCPGETWFCPRTARQPRLVVPSLREALPALIAGYIGARIGADITGTMDTDTVRTNRRTDMGISHTVRTVMRIGRTIAATIATDLRLRADW